MHSVAQGKCVFVDADGCRADRRARNAPQLFTRRQAEVFRHLSEDRAYSVIALEMKISVVTVRTHARAVFCKLGVQSRHELVGRWPSGGSPAHLM